MSRRILANQQEWFVLLACIPVIIASIWCRNSFGDEGTEVAPAFDDAALEYFEKRIRPILVKRCYECHSGRLEEPKGGLRVDSRPALLEGGDTGPALVAGDPKESLLVDAINYGDVYQMPPKSKMPAEEIAELAKWIKMGAPWPEQEVTVTAREKFDLQARKAAHWCWQPVKSVDPPQVRNSVWPKQELDHFILAKLEDAGLTPASPASRRTLIRRAYFDLIGLPPSAEQVEAFVNDDSPRAFARVVDGLLDSPHFGERWARHWMDLVRYAETYGHEFDYPIHHAHKYRDYLIRAFNANVPYDQFVIEHLAGDLIPDPRLHPTEGFNESVIGTGFWWLGEATHAPVDVRGDEAGRIDNQLDVMGKTFLGLTIGCARCHDHKFDAISTKDYYALSGYLHSSHRQHAAVDRNGRLATTVSELLRIQADAKQRMLASLDASEIDGPRFASYLLASRESLASDNGFDSVAARFDVDADQLARWVEALESADVQQSDHPLYAWSAAIKAATSGTSNADLTADLRKRQSAYEEGIARLNERYPLLAAFESPDCGWIGTGDAFVDASRSAWNWHRDEVALLEPGKVDSGRLDTRLQGVLRSPTFTITHPNIYYRIAGKNCKVMLIVDGYFMYPFNGLLFRGFSFDVNTDGKMVWIKQSQDLGRYVGHRAHLEIIDHGDGSVEIDEIRFSSEDGPPGDHPGSPFDVVEGMNTAEGIAVEYGLKWERAVDSFRGGAADSKQSQLLNWVLSNRLLSTSGALSGELDTLRVRVTEVAREIQPPDRVLAMCDLSSEDARVLVRGNHRMPGDVAHRQLLEALAGSQPPIESGSGRLELARQMVDRKSPLTARVMVNRIWHHLFGRGIVASVDNFGVLGQRPTHPELLDFLANRFIEDGWSVKQMIRTMALSRTYQMASTPSAIGDEVDPQNLLLHRMRIRRLQGEAIRDAILSISGRLDRKLFGGSIPVHITSFMQGRGRPKSSGPLDGAGRRSIYIEVRRNFLPPMMLAFDTPIPFNTVGRRNTSNVPAQALILMNDPFVVEQAGRWAERVLECKTMSTDERVAMMYLSAFARPPSQAELESAADFLRRQGQEYGLSGQEFENDPRVWTDLCHVLMNVKEFVFLN